MRKLLLVILAFLICGSVGYAGQLEQNENGFYYVKDDGQLAISEWVNFDIDGDGKQEYYYINSAGLLEINTTTPDGYQVNEKGQWIENGIVKTIESIPGTNISFEQLKSLIAVKFGFWATQTYWRFRLCYGNKCD